MLVGFAFAIMLAVVAPGGSNFVIAGAILIKMNLTDLPDGDPGVCVRACVRVCACVCLCN